MKLSRPCMFGLVLLVSPALPATEDEAWKDRLPELAKYSETILRSVEPVKKEAEGITVTVKVAADGYRYRMAKTFSRVNRAGLTGKKFWAELKKAHKELKHHRGEPLLLVSVRTTKGPHFFVQKNEDFLHASGKRERKFKVLFEKPKLRFEKWQVFLHPPEKMRVVTKKNLARFTELDIALILRPPTKKNRGEPFTFGLGNVVRQSRSSSSQSSVNVRKRQISGTYWNDLILPPIEFLFFPAEWKVPAPPEGFDELIALIEKR